MSRLEGEVLSPAARELLGELKTEQPLPPGAADRVLARLQQTLALPHALAPMPSAHPPPAPPGAEVVVFGKAKLLAVGLGLLGVVAAGVTWWGQPSAPSAPTSEPRVTTGLAASAPAANPATAPAPRRARSAAPPAPAPPSAASKGTAVSPSGAPRPSSLAEERALVERARGLLAAGQGQRALAVLAEHQAQFPGGRLGEERESLTIQALANTGQTARARQRFEAFRARHPGSIFLPALRAVVDSLP